MTLRKDDLILSYLVLHRSQGAFAGSRPARTPYQRPAPRIRKRSAHREYDASDQDGECCDGSGRGRGVKVINHLGETILCKPNFFSYQGKNVLGYIE